MPTNLAIDDKLIENARRIGKHRTKKAVVTEALIEYIQRREQLKIIGLFGTIDYDSDYDYKEQKKKKLKVIIDTSIWSLAFRRQKSQDQSIVAELESLINDFRVQLIGPIRQELLSGIKSENQFKKLKLYLRSFSDYQIKSDDFELAAQFFNECRAKGIQGSNTDFLISAIAINNNWQIYSSDQDFIHFQKFIPIHLYNSNN